MIFISAAVIRSCVALDGTTLDAATSKLLRQRSPSRQCCICLQLQQSSNEQSFPAHHLSCGVVRTKVSRMYKDVEFAQCYPLPTANADVVNSYAANAFFELNASHGALGVCNITEKPYSCPYGQPCYYCLPDAGWSSRINLARKPKLIVCQIIA